MPRITRANARRRISLLASSSLVATSMLAGFGTVVVTALTPSAALASVCAPVEGSTGPNSGPSVSGVATCVSGVPTTGIDYKENNGSGGLTVNLDGVTTTTYGVSVEAQDNGFITLRDNIVPSAIDATNNAGVIVSGAGGAVTVDFTHGATGTTVNSTGGDGIHLTNTGSGTITSNTTGTVQGSGNGVYTRAGTGVTTIGATAAVTGARNGIDTNSSGGDIHITAVNVNGGTNTGIYANAGGGSITVKDTGTVATTGNVGTYAITSGAGTITIAVKDSTTTNASSSIDDGVAALGGAGAVKVTSTGTVAGYHGVYARGSGAVTVNATSGAITAKGGFGDGIHTVNRGSGATAVTTINSGATIASSGLYGDGINARATGAGTFVASAAGGAGDGIIINTTADIGTKTTAVGGRGIYAEITNSNNVNNINVNLGGNIYAHATGLYTDTQGAGNIQVITQHGFNVNSTNGDGIDAFAIGGGNVYVHLLDGAVNSNTSTVGGSGASGPSGGGGQMAPSGGSPCFAAVGGVISCSPPLAKIAASDPVGVWATANGLGTVTVIADDTVNNKGLGDGIRTATYSGANAVTVDAAVTNTGGNGVKAVANGYFGNVTVTLGKAPTSGAIGSVVTTGGSTALTSNGVFANQTYAYGSFAGATINSTAGGSVMVTGAAQGGGAVLATVHDANGAAVVDMTGATGGTVSIEGAGGNIGVGAIAFAGNSTGTGYAGVASVTTNPGLTVSVGTLGGNNDIGVEAVTHDTYNAHAATVTLGASNAITVGALNAGVAVSNGNTGVVALAASGAATVTAGVSEHVTVTGSNSVGVNATVSNYSGAASVTFGDGGAIAVVDPTKSVNDVGVQVSSYYGSASADLGTTSVSTDGGVGIKVFNTGSGSVGNVTATSQGNVNAGLDGIDATTAGSGNVTVNYGTRAGTSPTLTAGTAGTGTMVTGIKASSTGSGFNTVAVNVGNTGSGATTIHATNIGISVTGGGRYTAGTVTLGNNVTIDPDHYGIYVNMPGTATVTTANNDTINVVADATVYAHHVGVYARSGLYSDGAGSPPGPGGPSVNVALGTNNTITVGDAPESVGIEGINRAYGSASVSITAGNGLNITSTGANSVGVLGYTYGFGNVTIGLGTGSITVAPGASGADTTKDFTLAAGVFGESYNGGNVAITTTGQTISVSNYAAGKTAGIFGRAYYGGNVTITDNGSGTITSANGDGIEAHTYDGNISIAQNGSSTINATNGDGIHAAVTGSGSINIGQSNELAHISAVNGDGISATITGGGAGNIYVGTTGSATNGGINGYITAKAGTSSAGIGINATTDGHGNVSTYSDTLIIKSDGAGILAQNTGGAGFGNVTVTANNGIFTTYGAGSQGIFATTNGNGTVIVNDEGSQSITTKGALADGIKASNTSGTLGGVGVYVTGTGTISATGNGIYATVNTADGVTVTTAQGSVVNGRLDGILATITNGGSGALVVTADGNIGAKTTPTGHNGISALSSSLGVIDVTQGANSTIYSGINGIEAISNATATSGNVTVVQAGTIVDPLAGNGIVANITNAANGADVNVTSHTITSFGDGVLARTSGSGNVTVKATGVINAAHNYGVYALASGGNSTVTTIAGAPVTGGIGIQSITTGVGNSIVTVNDNVTGTKSDAIRSFNQGGVNIVSVNGKSLVTAAGDGITASVTYGALTVNTAAGTDIETTNKGDGVHAVASKSGGTVTLNLLGTIGGTAGNAPTSGDGVYASTIDTALNINVVNTIDVGGTGVFATTAGAGAINVTTAAGTLIDTGKDGVNAIQTGGGAGAVTITANGNIGTLADPVNNDGLSAKSNGAGAVTVTQGAASKLYSNINGIVAFNTDAATSAPVVVNQLGSVTTIGGGNGIDAQIFGAKNNAAVTVTSHNINAFGAGVLAETLGKGAVTVNTTGTIVAGHEGVLATAAGGALNVNVGGATTGSIGVSATNNGAGGINITDSGFAVKGTTGDGISATSTGSGVINVGSSKAAPFTGNIYGQTNGVEAHGGSTVNVYTVGNITAVTGETVLASSTGGPVNVYTTGGTQIGATGINAISGASGASGATCVHNSDVITTTGARGIDAESKGGNVCVYSNKNITATMTGIYASTTGAGTVTVGSAANPITGVFSGMKGPGSAGIQAQSQAGAISINSAADMTALNGADFGIEATSTTGGISITNTGTIDPGLIGPSLLIHVNAAATGPSGGSGPTGGTGPTGTHGVNVAGISAISSGANTAGITIVNKGAIFVAGGTASAGINAVNAGTGTVSVTNSGAIDPAAYGIFMKGGGAVYANNSATITAGEGIYAATTGTATADTVTVVNSGAIYATVNPAPHLAQTDAGIFARGVNGAVVVTSTAPITSVGDGIEVYAGAGSITINASPNTTGADATAINAGGDGIEAINYGAGAIKVTTSGNVLSAGETGIFASAYGGGNVTITTNNQTLPVNTVDVVSGYYAGIVAISSGAGSTSVTANTAVNATGTGVFTYGGRTFYGGVGIAAVAGTGGVTVNANANVYGYGIGIATSSIGGGTINIAPGVRVSNYGGTSNPVIDIVTGTGTANVTTTLNNAGTISSNSAAPFNEDDLAIRAAGGNVTVNNTGEIDGRIDTSGVGNGFASTINNSGTWNSRLTSTFGSGTNTINNSGEITVRDTTTFAGTIALNNSGTISLGNNLPGGFASRSGLSDGDTDDVLFATGTTLNGLAGSTVALDADLSFTPQTSCAALSGAADCLAIAASTGTTGLLVTDTGAHALGSFNPGIAVVTGSSGASTFTLDPRSSYYNSHLFGGVLDKPGFFFYDLVYNAGTEYLVSAPKPAAVAFSAIGGAVSDVWYTTTQTWFDRQADLRDTVDGRAEGTAPAVWLKAFGDWSRRSGAQAFTTQGHTYDYDTSYNQDTAGLIGGIDALRVTGHDTAFVFGLQGGYVDSDVRFRSSSETVRMTGSVIGAYATYLAGPLFVDASFNSNFLTMGVDLPDTGPVFGATFDTSGRVRNLGGQIESGYALPVGTNAFVEPLGLLAYEQTHFDDLIVPGGVEHLNDVTSFRGALGGRVGINLPMEYYKVKLALVGRAWDEFNGDTNNTLFSAGPDVDFTNRIRGVFGEVQAEANVFENHSGFSAFLNGGIKFKTRYQEETATLGFRYDW